MPCPLIFYAALAERHGIPLLICPPATAGDFVAVITDEPDGVERLLVSSTLGKGCPEGCVENMRSVPRCLRGVPG